MYCGNCGKDVPDGSTTCPSCGSSFGSQPAQSSTGDSSQPQSQSDYSQQQYTPPQQYSQPQYQQYNQPYGQPQYTPAPDKGGFGWALLGFCIPIVGLILFIIWKNERPKTAKTIGIAALVSFILSILCTVLFYGSMIAMYSSGALN